VNGESPGTAGTAALAPTTTPVVGVLEVLPDSNAFLRSASRNYLSHPLDPFVSQNLIRQWRLKEGMEIAGTARIGGDRKARFGLTSVETINSLAPEDFNARKPYTDLVSIDPTERIRLVPFPPKRTLFDQIFNSNESVLASLQPPSVEAAAMTTARKWMREVGLEGFDPELLAKGGLFCLPSFSLRIR
jgi:hypothetical protein